MKKLGKGMFKDTARVDQPEGTMRDALNANINIKKGSISNEWGTTEYPTNANFKVIGRVVLDDDRIVMFGQQVDGEILTDQIRILDTRNQDTVILYENNLLNFQLSNPIVCTQRRNQASEILVYFTDGFVEYEAIYPSFEYASNYNPPRVINVTKQLQFRFNGGQINELYDQNNTHHKLQLIPRIGNHCNFEEVKILDGGALPSAAYYLALAYADYEGLETNYFTISNPVYIAPKPENTLPTNAFIGAEGGTPTSKSICWTINRLDGIDYELIQPVVIKMQKTAMTAVKLTPIQVPLNGAIDLDIVYSGTEDSQSIAVEDIVVDNVDYIAAESIDQLDNRLYMANVTSNKDIGYQPFAHNIRIDTVVDRVDSFDPRLYSTFILNYGYAKMLQTYDSLVPQQYSKVWELSGDNWTSDVDSVDRSYAEILNEFAVDNQLTTRKGYKDPAYSFKRKTYRRGEVYAFYISFVLNDGSETYAYHIPGREGVERTTINGLTFTNQQTNTSGSMGETDLLSLYSPENHQEAHGFNPSEMVQQNPGLRVYQIVDTSEALANLNVTTGYWENINERYPNTRDFLIGDVSNEGNALIDPANSLANTPVRHHRMPSNTNDSRSFMIRRNDPLENYLEWNYNPEGGQRNTASDLGTDGSMVVSESINIMGIRLSNVKIPREILGNVQGYKVYYAKRNQSDKTILGQSLAVPSQPKVAAVPEQNLEAVVSGPYVKAFYMYGGLDHTDGSTVDTIGEWKGNTNISKRYFSNPVFQFHDFTMLRDREDVSPATHIQCQYGVIFRQFAGGPGVVNEPVSHDKLLRAPSEFSKEDYLNGDPHVTYNDIEVQAAHSTTFGSMGWIHQDLRNTVDFWWADSASLGQLDADRAIKKAFYGSSRVLDISDDSEYDVKTIFTTDGDDGTSNFKSEDGAHDDNDNSKGAKRARKARKGRDMTQPAEDNDLKKPEKAAAVLAKMSRVRYWRTSTLIGTTYLSPSATINGIFNIKGGDGIPYNTPNYWWGDEFADNRFTLAIDAGSKILLHGKEDHLVKDSSSFKGAKFLFNRSGETSYAFGLVSGLPALKGHAPAYQYNEVTWNNRVGPVRWGESFNYLYPDAAQGGVPLTWQVWGTSPAVDSFNQDNDEFKDPKDYQGLNFIMKPTNQFYGLPMAWLVNVCATRTDVFNPFHAQQLVWTGHFQPIRAVDLDEGTGGNGVGDRVNYYLGAESPDIYGGDTYITKYSFRTTSQSYGHAYFRGASQQGDGGADSLLLSPYENSEGYVDYLNIRALSANAIRNLLKPQADIPSGLDYSNTNMASALRFGATDGSAVWNWVTGVASGLVNSSTPTGYDIAKQTIGILKDSTNWVKGDVNPVSTVYTFMCESDDLIGFRHVDDVERGETSMFFDYNTANNTVFVPPTEDLTKPDKLLYEPHFSALQILKVATPLPIYSDLTKVQTFPNRVVRSDVDSGSLADGFRKFRALEFKDIPAHRGEIKNLFNLNGNLYIHTDRSLFVTKGKEQLSIDAVTAFIGSGNIFTQDPDEVMQADAGHAGTSSRHAHVTTAYGHFYVNYRDKKVYNVSGQGIQDITNGMETWLRENMPFAIEQFGINLDSVDAAANGFYTDATTELTVPIGFTLGYDPLFKRVLITKHEPVPTEAFFEAFYSGQIVIVNNIPTIINIPGEPCNEGDEISVPGERVNFKAAGTVFCGPIGFGNPTYFRQEGWTVSYYPEMKVWGSRHSYRPRLYTNTSEFLISFAEDRSWEHTNKNNPGRFYGDIYNFEVEFIDNTGAGESKLFSNLFYWAESFLPDQNSISESFRISNPVFDEFYAYNSTQITGVPRTINYLNNARLVDRMWYINDIRDLSVQQQLNDGELITGTENVAGNITTSVTVHPQATTMFTEEGIVNNNYVNENKEWYNRRKMIDHYMGVRLIKDNTNRNLVHLYAAGTKFRKSFR